MLLLALITRLLGDMRSQASLHAQRQILLGYLYMSCHTSPFFSIWQLWTSSGVLMTCRRKGRARGPCHPQAPAHKQIGRLGILIWRRQLSRIIEGANAALVSPASLFQLLNLSICPGGQITAS